MALWTVSSFYCHPTRTPNAALVQSILSNLEDNLLAPYELSGNRLSRLGYATLPLPWDLEPDSSGNESDSDSGFDKSSFIRKVWDENGIPSSGPLGDFFAGTKAQKLEDLEKGLGSASMVIRWKEANPDLVGTEEDVVRVTMKKLREAMGDIDDLEASGSFALIMFKKAY
jgi:trans-aconitate 3-methyltransferase